MQLSNDWQQTQSQAIEVLTLDDLGHVAGGGIGSGGSGTGPIAGVGNGGTGTGPIAA